MASRLSMESTKLAGTVCCACGALICQYVSATLRQKCACVVG